MANEFVIKNGYFSQGNSNVTGSLQVTGSIGVTGSVSITQNVTASKALFSSSGVNQLMVIGSGSSSWLAGIYGSQGNIFTATDTMSGSLFTVADISGYPIFKIISDHYTNSIQMIGTASLTGSLSITENLAVGQNLTASKALISSSGNEQLMVMGSGSSSWITGIYGSQGNLLTVTDTMSGSLFTVADISGYPVLKVISDHYTNNVQIVGDTSLTGSLSITENLTASKALISSSNGDQLTVIGSGSTIAQVYGSQGNLLVVNDTFSGSIFTVTDISGYPILDITSDYYTGSVFIPMMRSQSQQHVVAYDSASGLLTYVSASAIGGGGVSTLQQVTDAGNTTDKYISSSAGFVLYDDTNSQHLTITDIDTGFQIASPNQTIFSAQNDNISIHYTDTAIAIIKNQNLTTTREYLLPDQGGTILVTPWTGSATLSGSIYLPALTTSSQQYVVTYNSESGQLFYTASSAIGGGGSGTPGGPNLSVQFNSASVFSGSSTIYIQNDGPSSIEYDHLRLDNAWLTIRDSSNNITFTSDGLTLGDSNGFPSLEWSSRALYDLAGTQSIQYGTRQLIYPHNPFLAPLIAIDWGTANQVTISGSVYTPNLTNLSQVNAVVIDTASGQLYYLPTSSIGGGSFNSTSSVIGNGLSSSYDINHGFNTRNLHITVYENFGPNYETVYPDIRRINLNTASIVFANPVSAINQYVVYISQ
jgi:hypothetical protein